MWILARYENDEKERERERRWEETSSGEMESGSKIRKMRERENN